jgi:hypothetical protein
VPKADSPFATKQQDVFIWKAAFEQKKGGRC